MSYILDALKKSEQERGHGNVPGVQTVHTSSLSYRDRKTYWPYILIAAVVLNLIVMLYFILDKETATNDLSEHQATEASPAAANSRQSQQASPAASVSIQQTPQPIQAQKAEKVIEGHLGDSDMETASREPAIDRGMTTDTRYVEPITESSTVTGIESSDENTGGIGEEIIAYHELDESIKRQLPALIVSAHVYSSNPQQRSIVINNNFLEEGEYIIDGLILQEITPDGAILNYNGILFRSDVVSGWR